MVSNRKQHRAIRRGFSNGEPTIVDLLETKARIDAFMNYYLNEEPCRQHPASPGDHIVRTYDFWTVDEEPECTVWSSSVACRQEILADIMDDYGACTIMMVEQPNILVAFIDQVIVVIE